MYWPIDNKSCGQDSGLASIKNLEIPIEFDKNISIEESKICDVSYFSNIVQGHNVRERPRVDKIKSAPDCRPKKSSEMSLMSIYPSIQASIHSNGSQVKCTSLCEKMILIVDDDYFNLIALQSIVSTFGIEAEIANTGADAVRIYQ